MHLPKLFFVFDVESVGLHGEGFAVGFIVVDAEGNSLETATFSCPFNAASGSPEGFQWCKDNLPEIPKTYDEPWLVRAAFWRRWVEWKAKGAVMVADCAWPVEARFLAACVDDNPMERAWQGPYPLHDLATLVMVMGNDPTTPTERLPNELPAHNPLSDAIQSARILIQNMPAQATG